MKPRPAAILLAMFLTLFGCLEQARSAVVTWDGEGGDLSWQNRTNWSGDILPGTADEVVINVPGDITITSRSNVTILSLQSSNSLSLTASVFRVTAGNSLVQGTISVIGNATLSASGPGTTFTGLGPVALTNANFEALAGATISLPNLSSYAKGTTCAINSWRANGTDSTLDFPGLTTLSGGQCGPLAVETLNGGKVRMTNLVSVTEGMVTFEAQGTNSFIDLSALDQVAAVLRVVEFEARNGGSISIDRLTGGPMVNVTVGPGGMIPIAHLTQLRGLAVEGPNAEFTALTNVNGGNVDVSSGALVTLPALTSHAQGTACSVGTWQVRGAGSVLHLPALTNVVGGSCGRLEIEARSGGSVIVTNLFGIAEGTVAFLADGPGSVLDLGSLELLMATQRLVQFEALNGGLVQFPSFRGGGMAHVTLASGGSMAVAQLIELRSFTVSGINVEFPALTNLNGGSISVTAGGNATAPQLTSFRQPSACSVNTWSATGAGSRLNLPALTNLVGGACGRLDIEARSGGVVVLTNLSVIDDGNLNFLADGAGSIIDLSALQRSLAATRDVSFAARNSGTILAPLLSGGITVNLTITGGGNMSLGQLDRIEGITISGTTITLPGLTNLSAGNLIVSSGAVVSLPNIGSHSQGSDCVVNTWQVSGPGSILDLSALTNLVGGSCGSLAVEALAGGQIILTNLTTIPEGTIAFLADGTNSVVDLRALPAVIASTRAVSFEARRGGLMKVDSLAGGPRVNVTLASGGLMSVAQMERLRGITVTGISADFPGLTNFDDGSFALNNGAIGTATNLATYTRGSGCAPASWLISSNSTLALAGLRRVTGGACAYLDAQALSGGQLLLPNLTNIVSGNVLVLASGAGSLVELSALQGFMNPASASRLIATNGGTILLAEPVIFSGVAIEFADSTPGLPELRMPATNTVLYGRAWHSYQVDQRDAASPGNEWRFLRRVPLTNQFQVIGLPTSAGMELRAHEFIANPAALELSIVGHTNEQAVLFGTPGTSIEIHAASHLRGVILWVTNAPITLTNSFRILPTVPAAEQERYFRLRTF